MGILESLFGKKQQTTAQDIEVPWIFLESMEQLDKIELRSQERPQLIFKHSSTCGISSMVLKMFNGSFDPALECDLYFLTIQTHRDISDAIASKFGVRHESPQLLLIKNGKVSFHTSHGAIANIDIMDHL